MTEDQKNALLTCLRNDSNISRGVVNGAIDVSNNTYDIVRLDFEEGVAMEEMREKYSNIYGTAEWKAKAELAKAKAEAKAEAETKAVPLCVSMVEFAASIAGDPEIFQKSVSRLVTDIALEFQSKICKELKKHQVIQDSTTINAFKQELRKQESEETKNQRWGALDRASQALENLLTE
jgi:hypothetical protein